VRRVERLAPLLTVVVLSSCAGRPANLHPVPQRAWQATLGYAQEAVQRGQYVQADSALVAFANQYPSTPQAAESEFWTALLLLDPRNEHRSESDALRALTAYSSGPGPHSHDIEADVLRRTAGALLTLREETKVAASQADSASRTEADSVRTEADSVRVAQASRERTREEVQRLRDSLDKVVTQLSETTQELDRIKKRLAAPKP
jgi:hypothetical protein